MYHILIYIVKSCPHKFLVSLKFWSSWGAGCKISKTPPRVSSFLNPSKIVLKISLLLEWPFYEKNINFRFFCFFSFTKDFLLNAESMILCLIF